MSKSNNDMKVGKNDIRRFVKKSKEKKDPIMEGIKSGRIYGMKCESLKESFNNLKFCPDREECSVLAEHLEWINEMEDLIRDMHCGFCESDNWLFIGITRDGIMITATTTKDYAEKLNKLIDKKRKEK